MKKKLLSLALAIIMILSLNIAAFASPGGGIDDEPGIGVGGPGVPAGRSMTPVECLVERPEDCQWDDDDNDD